MLYSIKEYTFDAFTVFWGEGGLLRKCGGGGKAQEGAVGKEVHKARKGYSVHVAGSRKRAKALLAPNKAKGGKPHGPLSTLPPLRHAKDEPEHNVKGGEPVHPVAGGSGLGVVGHENDKRDGNHEKEKGVKLAFKHGSMLCCTPRTRDAENGDGEKSHIVLDRLDVVGGHVETFLCHVDEYVKEPKGNHAEI